MKNDKLLTELYAIREDFGKVDAYIRLQGLIAEVESDIRDEENKASGKGSVAKAAERILKSAQGQPRDCLYKAYKGKKGVLICDTFRAVRFTSAPVLPTHPDGYEYPDIDHVIDGSKGNDVLVNVQSLGELRAFIKTEKARLKAKKDKSTVRLILPDVNGFEVHLNAEYLLDMLEALPGATVTASRRDTWRSAVYFNAENGDGVLLPLRPPEKQGGTR